MNPNGLSKKQEMESLASYQKENKSQHAPTPLDCGCTDICWSKVGLGCSCDCHFRAVNAYEKDQEVRKAAKKLLDDGIMPKTVTALKEALTKAEAQ